ncbi:hypothetical protein ERO13_A03G118738v2 [Gossypium hirsutum]|nr:hypothetical protein ERO13_A03G118738v2 [Gossypium hirsutum]
MFVGRLLSCTSPHHTQGHTCDGLYYFSQVPSGSSISDLSALNTSLSTSNIGDDVFALWHRRLDEYISSV